jgi:AraC-like DNA-binding protein
MYNSGGKRIGFIVYEIGNTEINLLESLTMVIGNAIQGIQLHDHIRKERRSTDTGQGKESIPWKKYRKLGIPEDKAIAYYHKLMYYMKKKSVFLHPELNVRSLSKITGIPYHHLSFIINQYAKSNFYDFINTFRVKKVIQELAETESKNTNLIDIAFKAGFKSKSTFNKFFKKYTQMTPSKYIQSKVPQQATSSPEGILAKTKKKG